jgi:uncharacterized protein YcbX
VRIDAQGYARGMDAHLASLHVYPVKSCRGVVVRAWPLEARGLRHDRAFMIVRPDGRFLTQRELPALARVATDLSGPDADLLELAAEGHGAVQVPINRSGRRGAPFEVEVWGDRVRAETVDGKIDRWLSAFAGEPLRLVHFPPEARRATDARYADGFETQFADGYPALLIGEASLAQLNARLAEPVSMLRFRPNLVVAGSEAFAEDGWRDLTVGEAALRVVKPCARCVIVTNDPHTGARTPEPLRTLASFRKQGQAVMFGQNAVVTRAGWLRIGDPVAALT